MRIYFAGSIRGGRDNLILYQQIISELKKYGEVLTEHIADPQLSNEGEGGHNRTKSDEQFICERDKEWLRQSDIVIAEVSIPSLGVGYELGYAESLNKRIICLYRTNSEKLLSAMIGGNKSFKTYEYESIEDLKTLFKEIF